MYLVRRNIRTGERLRLAAFGQDVSFHCLDRPLRLFSSEQGCCAQKRFFGVGGGSGLLKRPARKTLHHDLFDIDLP